MKKITTTKEDAMTTKKAHTCYPEDRREGQLDADCLRCQEIMANRIKREPKPKGPKTYTATYKGKPVRVTIPENEEG